MTDGMGIRHDAGARDGEALAQARDRAAGAVRARLGQHDGELAVAVAGHEIGQPELPRGAGRRTPAAAARIRLGIGDRALRLDVEQNQAEAE